MVYKNFIQQLENRLQKPLPGSEAHNKMASSSRIRELNLSYDINKAKKSAVLIPLFPKNSSIYTIFILKQVYDGVHSGQVAFAGDKMEKEDKDLVTTALRETEEEIGISEDKITVIGKLSDLYIPPSNFLVTPVIGYAKEELHPIPCDEEVAATITTDLVELKNNHMADKTTINVRGHSISAPYYDVKGHVVWGATAMILTELLEIIPTLNKYIK